MTFQKILSVMASIVLALTLGLASSANAQDNVNTTQTTGSQPSQTALTPEQLVKAIADAKAEIQNAEQQAEQFPTYKNQCLDNRDQWRVELLSLQEALIQRLQTDLVAVTGERDRFKSSLDAATARLSAVTPAERPDTTVKVDVQQTQSLPAAPKLPGQTASTTSEGNSQQPTQPASTEPAFYQNPLNIGIGVLVLLLVFLALNYHYEWVMGDKVREHKAKREAAKAERELVQVKGQIKELVQAAGTIGSRVEKEMGALEDEVDTLKGQNPVDQARVDAAVAKKARLGRPGTQVADKVDDVKNFDQDLESLVDLEAAKKKLEAANKAMAEVQKAVAAYEEAKKAPPAKK